jgi:hypothetical protein
VSYSEKQLAALDDIEFVSQLVWDSRKLSRRLVDRTDPLLLNEASFAVEELNQSPANKLLAFGVTLMKHVDHLNDHKGLLVRWNVLDVLLLSNEHSLHVFCKIFSNLTFSVERFTDFLANNPNAIL